MQKKRLIKIYLVLWIFITLFLVIIYKKTGFYVVSSYDLNDGNSVDWGIVFNHLPQIFLASLIISVLGFYFEWKMKNKKEE